MIAELLVEGEDVGFARFKWFEPFYYRFFSINSYIAVADWWRNNECIEQLPSGYFMVEGQLYRLSRNIYG